jgi:hypothetical protein
MPYNKSSFAAHAYIPLYSVFFSTVRTHYCCVPERSGMSFGTALAVAQVKYGIISTLALLASQIGCLNGVVLGKKLKYFCKSTRIVFSFSKCHASDVVVNDIHVRKRVDLKGLPHDSVPQIPDFLVAINSLVSKIHKKDF